MQDNQVQATKDQLMQKTRLAVQQIDEVLSQLSSTVHSLADEIGSGKLQRSQILERLEKTMDKTPQMFGMGVAYIPYLNDPQTRRHSPYYTQGSSQTEDQDLLQVFTAPCSYNDPTIQYKMSKCLVFVDYSRQDIKALMNTLDLGKTGYGFILSKQGVFLAHPIEEYVKSQKTIFNIADIHNDNALKRLGERAINNESGVMEYINPMTGQTYWIFYQPIPTTGWVMGTVVIKDEVLGQTLEDLRHKQIWICVWIIICLLFFFALLFRAECWLVVFSSSLLLLISIGFIWYLAQTAPFRSEAAIIVDKANLNQFLSTKPFEEPPLFIPTGVLIESIEFSGEHVNLTGQIWQKYDDDFPSTISRSFVLPDGESIKIKEVYRRQENQKEVIGWYFEGTVHQQFDTSKYPLDRREINLLIRHNDKNVILTPDLEAYQWINPVYRPGIKRELVLPGWHLKTSFFNYRNHDTGLYFTVFIQRDFLNPFIGSLLPLIVVGAMVFAILLLLGKVRTFANVAAPLAALFLATLMAHIGLRIEMTVPDIFYVESFYIVMYIAILAVVISYFLFHTKSKLFFIQYRNGLVAKLLFWPLILGSMLGITVWMFV
ncbi:MAG: cache domain-containing protein [Pseudomonadota bacterium]